VTFTTARALPSSAVKNRLTDKQTQAREQGQKRQDKKILLTRSFAANVNTLENN